MNRYKLSVSGVNPSEGIARFNGNEEKYEKYLAKFPQDGNYADLCQAIRAGDGKAAFAAAHALKGIAGNLSLVKLYADIQPLVEQLRRGDLDRADELLEPVIRDYEIVIAALQQM